MTEINPDVIIHTGNLLKSQHSKRFLSKNALSKLGHKNRELELALESSFKPNQDEWNHLNTTDSPEDFESVRSEENEISISTKVFLSKDSKPEIIAQAVTQLESKFDLGARFKLDILILSFPTGVKVEFMRKFYDAAERLVAAGKVAHIGLADLCLRQIEQLSDEVSVKPGVIQVDYTSHRHSCNSKLVEYAMRNDMLTLIHTDCTPFITSAKINEISASTSVKTVEAVIRYAITAKTRSVLLAKGYFLFLENQI